MPIRAAYATRSGTITTLDHGVLLALLTDPWLMHHYELPRLPLPCLPAAAALLQVLGQLAVAVPTRRAARLPPASASRSV